MIHALKNLRRLIEGVRCRAMRAADTITSGFAAPASRLLKKTHMPIALSMVEGCAQSPRSDVPACKAQGAKSKEQRRTLCALPLALGELSRLASEIFLSSLQPSFSATC